MYKLLIDIGNSVIKTVIATNSVLENSFYFTKYERNNFRDEFEKFVHNYINKIKFKKVSSAGISLCNSRFRKITDDIIKKYFGIKPYTVSRNSILPIKLNYPTTLGIDRICSSVSAVSRYKNKSQLLVIDYGTATTFNVIINKVFLGGLISPGFDAGIKLLLNNTSLPKPNFRDEIKFISKTTKSSILSGLFYQTFGMTEYVISGLKNKYKKLYVICTGGSGRYFYIKSKSIRKYHPFLVQEGINEIMKFNNK